MDYGKTVNPTLLVSVPLGSVTVMDPVVAPAGTEVTICVGAKTLNVVGMPLKLTAVAPVRFVPRIVTLAPTLPKVRTGCTNGPRPTSRRKIVPLLYVPPNGVAP